MSVIEDNYETLAALGRQAARAIRRQFPMVEYDDLAQVALMWCVQHPRKLAEYLADDDHERLIVSAMKNACKDYARRERADRLGNDLTDDVWYRFRQLRQDLLPAVFDYTAWTNPPKPLAKSRGGDPAEGGNWVTTLADVSRAVSTIDTTLRSVLHMRYRDKMKFREIAEALDVSVGTAHNRVNSAVTAVQEALGGFRPHDDPAEADWWHEGPGSRRAISNAHARAITNNQYGE